MTTKSYIDEKAFELTDPREHEERKYRGIWQVLNCANDIYSKYKTIEALVSGIENESYSKGREDEKNDDSSLGEGLFEGRKLRKLSRPELYRAIERFDGLYRSALQSHE